MSRVARSAAPVEIWIEQGGSTGEDLARTLESVAKASSGAHTTIVVVDPAHETTGRDVAERFGADVVLARPDLLNERLRATSANAILWVRRATILQNAIERIESALARFPEVVVVGADSRDDRGVRLRRPDDSPLRLRAQDHLGPVVGLRVDAALRLGGFAAEDASVVLYELVLRLSEAGARSMVVPEVLAIEQTPGDASARWEAELEVVEGHLRADGVRAVVEATGPGVRRIRYLDDVRPLVSVIIPTRGTAAEVAGGSRVLVVEAIRGIIERSSYQNLEFVVVADSVTPDDVVDELVGLLGDRLRLVEWDKPFNFSAKVNHGIAAARGEYLLVLNDDTDLVTGDWIETFIGLASQRGVGVVGAFLYFEDGSIQHAGHLYTGGSPGHVGFKEHGGYDDALGSLSVDREVSGVTGACLFVSAEIAREVGGFSLELPGNYNDVDFCMKVRATGRRIIVSPFVRLYHFESKSRDPRVSVEDTERLQRRWLRQIQVETYSRMQLG
ncbi:glycosyltransferase [Agromyces sp. NPDC058136]|uniref:glycosyltransferase n=1 Tax=Agromyces sp. NPDC058136 TaxID=3346354 RepID=UPI0036DEBA93